MTTYRKTDRTIDAPNGPCVPAPGGWLVLEETADSGPTQSINGYIVLLTDEEIAARAAEEAAIEPVRRMVAKSTVIARLTDAQLTSARAIFNQQPRMEARWYSPDHPAVYADDPDTLALLRAIGADPAVVMAAE